MKPSVDVTLLSRAEVLSARHFPSMLLLALATGAVNAGAFAVSSRFVTHVTGTVTRIGLDAGQWLLMGEYAGVLAAFIVGAMASVVAIQGRALKGKAPLHYGPLVGAAAMLLAVAGLGAAGVFGPMAGGVETPGDFLFLGALAFSMGLLNAGVASSTALVIRSTHMTGPATDFGVSLATAWFSTGDERRAALQLAWLRGGKLVSFAAGAVVMSPLVGAVGYAAFAAPAAVLLLVTVRSFVPSLSAARMPVASRASALARS